MAEYSVTIKPSAAKELGAISDIASLTRLIERIAGLAAQPRPWPPGTEKLARKVNLYRVRQGQFRIIYSIGDTVKILDIVKVGHRSDLYR